ncbi:unnamed protein product [Meganyctiphanes norvegica]|uniref:Uncharacterized protein n=1 Tax=Meganyctiphanes norvegica TaxID=48144 RepID=A0AAV2SL49_MEGNR
MKELIQTFVNKASQDVCEGQRGSFIAYMETTHIFILVAPQEWGNFNTMGSGLSPERYQKQKCEAVESLRSGREALWRTGRVFVLCPPPPLSNRGYATYATTAFDWSTQQRFNMFIRHAISRMVCERCALPTATNRYHRGFAQTCQESLDCRR